MNISEYQAKAVNNENIKLFIKNLLPDSNIENIRDMLFYEFEILVPKDYDLQILLELINNGSGVSQIKKLEEISNANLENFSKNGKEYNEKSLLDTLNKAFSITGATQEKIDHIIRTSKDGTYNIGENIIIETKLMELGLTEDQV